jgi:hypothetical protein
MVDASVAAISVKASIAPRAMPSALAAEGVHKFTYQARGWYSGPVAHGGASDRRLRRSGTTMSSMVKSWLPVPRMPMVCHVSTMVT